MKGSSLVSSAQTFYSLAICGVHVNDFNYSSEFWFDRRKRSGSMSNNSHFQMDKLNPFLLSMKCSVTSVSFHLLHYGLRDMDRCKQYHALFKVHSYILCFFFFSPLNANPILSQKQVWASVWCTIPASTLDQGAALSAVLMRCGRSVCKSQMVMEKFQSLIPYVSLRALTEACNNAISVSVMPTLMIHGHGKRGRIMAEWQEPWGQQA